MKDRSLTIQCDVETKARDGVIVAHGGAAVGYTLYLKEGRVVFAVRQPAKEVVRITSPSAIGDKTLIEARLSADGTMKLSLDGKEVATGKSDGPLKRQPAEAFCLGHDDGQPVDDYDGKKLFQGTIRNLKVRTEAKN